MLESRITFLFFMLIDVPVWASNSKLIRRVSCIYPRGGCRVWCVQDDQDSGMMHGEWFSQRAHNSREISSFLRMHIFIYIIFFVVNVNDTSNDVRDSQLRISWVFVFLSSSWFWGAYPLSFTMRVHRFRRKTHTIWFDVLQFFPTCIGASEFVFMFLCSSASYSLFKFLYLN